MSELDRPVVSYDPETPNPEAVAAFVELAASCRRKHDDQLVACILRELAVILGQTTLGVDEAGAVFHVGHRLRARADELDPPAKPDTGETESPEVMT